VGGLLLVGLFGGYGIRFAESLSVMEEDAAHQMGKMVRRSGKPMVIHSLFASAKPHALDLARYYSIPVYDSLDIACKCVGVLADYGRYLKKEHALSRFNLQWGTQADPEVEAMIQTAKNEGRRVLLEPECKRLLQCHQAATSVDRLAQSADEAVEAAESFDAPVAMKIVSPHILHKSDAGGVRLNVIGPHAVGAAFDEIVSAGRRYAPDADIRGVLVAPMAEKGTEVIVGTKYDDQFGPVIMFGIGGVLVEILKDVVFRVLPLSEKGARELMEEIRLASILEGVRGQPAGDKEALQRLLLKISDIIEAYPQIEEMDLNPVIVHQKGVSVVDARIILKE
jgi:acetyltransferase